MLKTQSMNLDYIRTFVVVGQSKDYKEAANKLNIDYTNVSRHIKALEDLMETKLINRNSKNIIELTEDGKKLFDGYEKAYNTILFTEKNYIQGKSLNTGKLSIGASKDIENDVLFEKVKKFKMKYPDVIVKIINGETKELFEKLSKYYIDFVIDEKYWDLKKNSDIKSKKIVDERYCIAYSDKHFDIQLDTIEKLSNLPLILPVSDNQDRIKFEKLLSDNKIDKNLSLEVANYEASRDYAMSGLGFALLPKKYIENSNLNYLDIELDKEISISYINGNLSPSAKEFLKLFESDK